MKKRSKKPQGSILIWTVLMGISLTTVFFFFSQRLNLGTQAQLKSIEAQNAQLFLDSYVDYLTSLSPEQLKAAATSLEEEGYEGITGTLIPKSNPQIKGVLDAGQEETYPIENGWATIEWNLCAKGETGRELEVGPVQDEGTSACKAAYERRAESQPSTPFTLKAGPIPVSYKITPMGPALLSTKEWKLDLKLSVNAKKTLSVQRTFSPVES